MFEYHSLSKFAKSQEAVWIAFFWGFCEATFFFVVPDFFFMFTALFSPLHGILHAMVSVAGTLLGGWVMYHLAVLYPSALQDFLAGIPLISSKLIQYVQLSLLGQGLDEMFSAPRKGIPYKIYAVAAGQLSLDLGKFLFLTIPVRLVRILLLAIVAAGAGKLFAGSIRRYSKGWILFYLGAWGMFYFFYARKMTVTY